MNFCILLKMWVKNISNNLRKDVIGRRNRKLLHHAKKSAIMHFRLLQKDQFKKQQKQLAICLVIKFLLKLGKLQRLHKKIVQRRLQMRIKKYLKKDIFLQKKTQNC